MRLTADFWSETTEAGKKWDNIYKMFEEKQNQFTKNSVSGTPSFKTKEKDVYI